MKADAYVVKNPHETKNAYTKIDAGEAAEALNLTSGSSIDDLKNSLKGYDFTSISTNDLAELGSLLYRNGLIDEYMTDFFISGSMATDETGHQTEKDVKFNVIAMFNQKLEERLVIGRSESASGFHEITRGLLRANHAIGALSYFSGSNQNDLSVSIKA
jgi:hypothetical protein